jgi:hypothetical protein
MVQQKTFAWSSICAQGYHTLTRINDAIRSLRSPLVCTAARMNAGVGGEAPVSWHYHGGLSLHGVLPSLAGGEGPGRCRTAWHAVPYRLPWQGQPR